MAMPIPLDDTEYKYQSTMYSGKTAMGSVRTGSSAP